VRARAAFRASLALLRLLPGPLALAAFFLPWFAGPGPFASVDFSGYSLLAFAGRLQALDLAPSSEAGLWGVRIAILGVPLAATWLTLLTALRHNSALALCSGLYLVATAAALGGLALSGHPIDSGAWLLIAAAALFALTHLPLPHRPAHRETVHLPG
jgi:hypothetical protein